MIRFNTIFKYFFNRNFRFLINHYEFNLYRHKSDEWVVSKLYFATFSEKLNLANPLKFEEKIQYLKLNYKNELYPILVDKYAVREYISKTIGDEFLIPLYGKFNSFKEINFNLLPEKFVLKCNHNSGSGILVCKNKQLLSDDAIAKYKKDVKKALKYNFYFKNREWPYKNIKPCIICEKFISDGKNNEELTDYKFYCFRGYVDCVMVCKHADNGKILYYFFDKDWNLKKYNINATKVPKNFTLEKPKKLKEMFNLASKLSEKFPFVRIDLYNSGNKIYFGEFTFYPDGGLDKNYLPEAEIYFGDLIKL